jgi:hypothetical protein
MRVTLAQYQLLTAEEKAKVTHIDASVADAEPYADMQMIFLRKQLVDDQWDKDHEDDGR